MEMLRGGDGRCLGRSGGAWGCQIELPPVESRSTPVNRAPAELLRASERELHPCESRSSGAAAARARLVAVMVVDLEHGWRRGRALTAEGWPGGRFSARRGGATIAMTKYIF